MNQLDLFQYQSSAKTERDKGMKKVYSNTTDKWRQHCKEIIVKVAKEKVTFTSDDVIDSLVDMPHDRRAVGPALISLMKEGFIVNTGQYAKSRRRHLSPISIWRIKR